MFCIFFFACGTTKDQNRVAKIENDLSGQSIVILGIAQDAGYPQLGCDKECCQLYWQNKEQKHFVTSLALIDKDKQQYWLFDATPDITHQLQTINNSIGTNTFLLPTGIFLTHAHIGHYTGLLQLGKEVVSAKQIPVYAMPRMDSFLRNNAPWNQLVNLQNIQIQQLKADSVILLPNGCTVKPILVPHRDEFSETVGYVIGGSKKKIMFIPDIDKWSKWKRNIVDEIANVDVAILDGTFYRNGELPGRDMREVPHPFVEETMSLLENLPASEKKKIIFIHFNHTNPLVRKNSTERKMVQETGFNVATEGMVISL